jgi:hypothetical protein
MQAQRSLRSHLKRRLGTSELFGEFMGEAFGVFEVSDHLRRRHGRQLGVVFERALRDGLRRGDTEEKREHPARGEWQAQRARDEGEQSSQWL